MFFEIQRRWAHSRDCLGNQLWYWRCKEAAYIVLSILRLLSGASACGHGNRHRCGGPLAAHLRYPVCPPRVATWPDMVVHNAATGDGSAPPGRRLPGSCAPAVARRRPSESLAIRKTRRRHDASPHRLPGRGGHLMEVWAPAMPDSRADSTVIGELQIKAVPCIVRPCGAWQKLGRACLGRYPTLFASASPLNDDRPTVSSTLLLVCGTCSRLSRRYLGKSLLCRRALTCPFVMHRLCRRDVWNKKADMPCWRQQHAANVFADRSCIADSKSLVSLQRSVPPGRASLAQLRSVHIANMT